MKRSIVILFLSLALVSGVFAAQNKNAKAPAKPAPAKAAPVDDASITAAVKEKLSKSASLKDAGIDATTKDGVVTLTGKVKTGGLKGAATNLAKSVKGVKKVDNQITVEPKPKPAAANKNAKPAKATNKNSK